VRAGSPNKGEIMILKQCIEKLMRKQNLSIDECQQVINEIIDEDANVLQIAAFLVLLRAKPETPMKLWELLKHYEKKCSVFQ
jgi:anthranilate phosphoribosyltransferase